MIVLLQRFQDLAVKLILYAGALASVTFERLCPGCDALEIATADPDSSPQRMLVRLTTIMIAGSLTMLALGYPISARPASSRA